uniref:NADH-ubiquinone oxidoreductase chain 1 n=1 Tax=Schistosoma japonicum TaxID=6182 RepID=G9B144_SCHJA|nr:NADH dehydrogenase subunit 1 [Schistosoma japonicum]
MDIWNFLVWLEGLLVVLFLVAFFILSERKVLGYIQLRKGPNKVGLVGLFQSFADFIKLLSKYKMDGYTVHSWFSWFGCAILLICSSIGVFIYASDCGGLYYKLMMLYILILSTFTGYGLLMLGWGSWNKYSLISAVRVAFASISFEATFMCLVLVLGVIYNDYGNLDITYLIVIAPLNYFAWSVSLLAESNRSPFDYGESESELVSGLNTEYSGLSFIVIFAFEYVMMFISSWITSIVFYGSYIGLIIFHLFLFIWARGTFPRVRYDYYVAVVWKYGLVVSLIYLLSCYGLIIIIS